MNSLREHFRRSTQGSGRLVLVSGGIASGKTRLLNDFLDHAAESGALTLRATGAPDEREFGTAIIDQLLSNPGLPAELSERAAEVQHGPPNTVQDAASPADTPLLRDVCRAILNHARDQAVVIGIDDLQFLDEVSLQLLLQLQRRIQASRLLLVLNKSDHPANDQQRLHACFARQPHYHVHLVPLSRATIAAGLSTAFGGEPATGLAARVHELTAGNPLLADALIQDNRHPEPRAPLVTGTAFAQAVQEFLARGDDRLREVAGALAVLGASGTTELVSGLIDVAPADVEESVAVLTASGLLENGRFRHAATQAATLESVSPAAKSRLHLRAAELKHQQAAPLSEVAGHLVTAGAVIGNWSIPVLRRAAALAARTEDIPFATRCLKLALSAATDPAERQALVRSLAWITWRVNPSGTTSYLETLRQAAVDGNLEHADSAVLVRHALWNGDRETYTTALNVLTSRPEALDQQTEAELKLAYQWYFGPQPQSAATTGGRPEPDPWHQAAHSLSQVWTQGGNDTTTASAERILQNCKLSDTTLEALVTAIIALVLDNRPDRAEKWWATLSEEAARHGATTWRAMLDGVWSSVVLRSGDVAGAAARAQSALGLLGAPGWGASISYPLTSLLWAYVTAGRFADAAEILRYPVPEAMFETIGGLLFLRARGHYYLATGRALAAVSDFQEFQRSASRVGSDIPILAPWRTDLAEANLRLGNLDVARDLARQQLAQAGEADGYLRGMSLRVLALAGRPEDRPVLLDRAIKCFTQSGDRLEVSRTTAILGRPREPWREMGGGSAPRPPGALRPAHAKKLPEQHARTGAGEPVDSAVLSEAELRVAQLAALGRTNREIGSTLFITVSTVEQHLTRVYRKLGVSGRSQLPAELGDKVGAA
ncbi:AAA family ATPase [Amycolatopsis sp. NPDC059027]|uniref:helix-turn-helix transcriptional regulator n=1 Tax=unclassified Amycolatopsis TaxID=2618356 RepID=UPI003670EC2C